MIYIFFLTTIFFTGACTPTEAHSEVKVSSLFTDNMVIQRNKNVPVWGTTSAGGKVTVSFAGQHITAMADNKGKWKIMLKAMTVNDKPQDMVIESKNKIVLKNILVGDVWLASGQSNMVTKIRDRNNNTTPDSPLFRVFKVSPVTGKYGAEPLENVRGQWASLGLKDNMSAVAYFFGTKLQKELKVPLGIIVACSGSSSDSCWVSKEIVTTEHFLPTWTAWGELINNWDTHKSEEKYAKRRVDHPSHSRLFPTGSYNAKLYGLFPFAMTGIIWYQGEANRHYAWQYKKTFPLMISHWREKFQQGDLPFIQVQLPDLGKSNDDPNKHLVPELRDVQDWVTKEMKNVYRAVYIDANVNGGLHPSNKQIPGARLMSIALAKVYNKQVPFSGPVYKNMTIEGDKVIVHFDYAKGLQTAVRKEATSLTVTAVKKKVNNFYVAGKDKIFVKANAVIDKEMVVVSADGVKDPLYVRYAYSDGPKNCNLYNGDGFPAAPFRTDSFEYLSKDKYLKHILLLP